MLKSRINTKIDNRLYILSEHHMLYNSFIDITEIIMEASNDNFLFNFNNLLGNTTDKHARKIRHK